MKNAKKISALVLVLLLFASCQKENLEQDATVSLTSQINISAKSQLPNVIFDITKKGIYHGIIASTDDPQSRGKLWINLGNNTKYTAVIEMVDGTTSFFKGVQTKTKPVVYNFRGKKGSFTVKENTVNSPKITNMRLSNQDYLGYAIKSTSTNKAVSYTGYYEETNNDDDSGGGIGGGLFTGTWNLLANGTGNPNGYNGIPITEIVVTHGSQIFLADTPGVVSSFNFFNCFSATNWVPIVNFSEEMDGEGFVNPQGDGIIAPDQSSVFVGDLATGVSEWSLVVSHSFFNSLGSCPPNEIDLFKGTFSWTNNNGSITRSGDIYITP